MLHKVENVNNFSPDDLDLFSIGKDWKFEAPLGPDLGKFCIWELKIAKKSLIFCSNEAFKVF